jgi:hypothetical protein
MVSKRVLCSVPGSKLADKFQDYKLEFRENLDQVMPAFIDRDGNAFS